MYRVCTRCIRAGRGVYKDRPTPQFTIRGWEIRPLADGYDNHCGKNQNSPFKIGCRPTRSQPYDQSAVIWDQNTTTVRSNPSNRYDRSCGQFTIGIWDVTFAVLFQRSDRTILWFDTCLWQPRNTQNTRKDGSTINFTFSLPKLSAWHVLAGNGTGLRGALGRGNGRLGPPSRVR